MTPSPSAQLRPGGRSTRVREAVFEAALALLEEQGGPSSIPEVATRAGVAASSLYRRWGSWETLVAEAMLASSHAEIVVPDTGSLRQDLIDFATSLAQYLDSPRGYALAQAAVTAATVSEFSAAGDQFWAERFKVVGVIIDRARQRGEIDPQADGRLILEAVVAPLHFRRLMTHQNLRQDLTARVDLILRGVGVSRA